MARQRQLQITPRQTVDIAPRESFTVEQITPDLARVYLGRNTQNRPLSRQKVERFRAFILASQWQLNHQGIAFDTEGVLIDGQHRLTAIVEANATVPMLVARNMNAATRGTIDTLGVRRVAHTFAILGSSTSPQRDAAVASSIRNFLGDRSWMSYGDAVELRRKHAAGFKWLSENDHKGRTFNAPVAAGFVYAYGVLPETTAESFAAYRDSVFPSATDPMCVLQRFVIRVPGKNDQGVRLDLMRRTLTAIWLRDKHKQRERLTVSEEAIGFFTAAHGDQ